MIFKPAKDGVTCSIKVIPNATKSALGEILKINDGKVVKHFLKVYVKTPAVEGKANQELINFLSKIWDLKKSQIKIIKGTTQPYKTLLIKGNSENLILKLAIR